MHRMRSGGVLVMISEAFSLIADLAIAVGAAPLNACAGCWEYRLGNRWLIAVNGHGSPVKCSSGPEVPPYHAYVERGGWPGGLLAPDGGVMLGYGGELEDELIAELKLALHGPGEVSP